MTGDPTKPPALIATAVQTGDADQTIETRLRENLPKIRELIIDLIADAAVKKLICVDAQTAAK